jgi:hypothetical protein
MLGVVFAGISHTFYSGSKCPITETGNPILNLRERMQNDDSEISISGRESRDRMVHAKVTKL